MTGQEPAGRMADVLAAAERAGFTGAIYGAAAFNPSDDRGVRQVFIYRRGACTDSALCGGQARRPCGRPFRAGHCCLSGAGVS